MNYKVKSEKFRKLSVASLTTGIISISIAVFYNFLWIRIVNYFYSQSIISPVVRIFAMSYLPVIFLLSLAAVICGSIDLKRIKAGSYSNKGKGFDIAGIVTGGVVILSVVVFMLGEIIFPH